MVFVGRTVGDWKKRRRWHLPYSQPAHKSYKKGAMQRKLGEKREKKGRKMEKSCRLNCAPPSILKASFGRKCGYGKGEWLQFVTLNRGGGDSKHSLYCTIFPVENPFRYVETSSSWNNLWCKKLLQVWLKVSGYITRIWLKNYFLPGFEVCQK